MLLHSKGKDKQGKKTALRMGENNNKLKRQRIHFHNIQADLKGFRGLGPEGNGLGSYVF